VTVRTTFPVFCFDSTYAVASTTSGTVYENSYVWILTLSGGKVVDGTAFYDSIAFNQLWETVTP
jgi:ketosteroid isomerase-like protein